MKTIGWLAIAVCPVITAVHAARQQPASEPHAAAALVTEFRANEWTRRAAAFARLQEQPDVLTLPQKKQILTEVVERENREIDNAFREGPGASEKFGESYSEYTATVAPYLLSIVDGRDVDAIAAVAQTAYHYNSILARQLATYGDVLLPTILRLSISDISPKRWQALGLAGEMLRLNREQPTRPRIIASSLVRLKEVLVAATRDENITVRKIAVRNIGVAGLREFLPVLESIAQTDPGVTTFGGSSAYPVRDEARTAIARIRSGQ